jgi:hypothetical protein
MKKLLALLLFSFAVNLVCFSQVTLNDVMLPAMIKKENADLVLNGAGIRKKVIFKLYVAGLYLKEKTKDASEIIPADKPMLMRLTITSRLISSSNMSEAIEEGFKKSMNGNTAPLQGMIDLFINTFKKEEIKGGDVFEIGYTPNLGVQTYKNGKYQGVIPGLDFKKALFGIWLSPNPVDSDLKKGLLGL